MQRRETIGDKVRLGPLVRLAVVIRRFAHGCGGFKDRDAASTRRSVPRARSHH
jgi:hypothetical protein